MQESELDAEGKPVEDQTSDLDQVTFVTEEITVVEGGDVIEETVVVSSIALDSLACSRFF